MSTPEALRLAGVLERMPLGEVDQMAADMLRAQAAEIERLTAALDESRAERSVAYLAFEQVTADRDALRAALQSCLDYGAMTGAEWVTDKARAALAAAPAPAPAPAPLTVDDVVAALSEYPMLFGIAAVDRYEVMQFVRIVERAHGIGTDARAQAQGGKP